MSPPRPAQPDDDLIYLSKISDSQIASSLNERFAKDKVYTRIGENILLSVNPYKPLDTHDSVKQWGSAVKDGKERDPHVFEMAAHAYYEMVKSKEDHSIVFLGESGSGKSENFKLALRQIVAVSRSKKKDDKLAGRILKSHILLEAFGHAKTTSNDNSSRFGKSCEMQFNNRGKLTGMKISDYLLDKKRVYEIPYGERSFHVFYYLLAGLSGEDKSRLHLQDPSKFHFLSKSKTYRADTIDDVSKYAELKSAMKVLGFKEKYIGKVFDLLAAILHLGNIDFIDGDSKEEAAAIRNHDLIELLSDLLGIRGHDLENALVYKTKLIKNEICTIFLDKDEADEQRNALASTLYSLLWSWLLDHLNRRLCDDMPSSLLTLVDLFGLENLKENGFHQLLTNFTHEKLLQFMNMQLFDHEIEVYRQQNVTFPETSYADNTQILDIFTQVPTGLLPVLNEEASKTRKRTKNSVLIENWNTTFDSNRFYISFPKKSKSYLFGIHHHSEDIHYDAKEFIESNAETISPDFVTLFRGGSENRASKNSFIANLFTEKAIQLERAPKNEKTIVGAMQLNVPRRKPSTRRTKKDGDEKEGEKEAAMTFAAAYEESLEDLLDVLKESKNSFVLCLKPNQKQTANQFESKLIKQQIQDFGITDLVQLRSTGYNLRLPFDVFADRYRLVLDDSDVLNTSQSGRDKVLLLQQQLGWSDKDLVLGHDQVFLTEAATRTLNQLLRAGEKQERHRIKEKVENRSQLDSQASLQSFDHSDIQSEEEGSQVGSEFSDQEQLYDTQSTYGSEYSFMTGAETSDVQQTGEKGEQELHQIEEEEEPISATRRNWLRVTRFLTWWIPSKTLEWNGMKRADIQLAWREKVALNILIILLSAIMLFFIIGFGLLLCPNDNMFDHNELASHSDTTRDLYVAVYGMVYDMTSFQGAHSGGPEFVQQYAGKDGTGDIFYYPPQLCGLQDDPPIQFNGSFLHPYDKVIPILNRKQKKYWKGFLAWTKDEIKRDHSKADSWFIIVKNNVYDMTLYRKNNEKFLGDDVTAAVLQFAGQDATDAFKSVSAKSALKCMDQIYFVGVVDTRDSPQCYFANALLLSATAILVAIMVIKFLSALQFSSKGEPEDHDRFVICMVPCYTEGEESLKRTLDSLATLRYDDKRKLLLIVCDGNIIGSGNDRATWRIVLDILGVDPSIDPPKLSFQSLGEGNRQHNMGKVYTGLYDISGHLVPYLVVVKVGKDNESRRPGNRGKRDSQLILMRFLQKVHYDEPMSPLELEMYHQVKNVIGVDPSFYEFVLMVDADTEVVQDSLNRLVSAMVHDAKIVGICGETTLANERETIITMMQVYEYYISHHLAKAFESLFGSVTCLPGCFCMYRIRTPNKSIPLLIAKPVVQDYAENNVDTLHKKNLLSLGEDRYLTTLNLKHFPNMKICFTPHAICKTYAPDRWSILLSQRRRWINSTVHNLLELLLLPQLCGFCCFSMRFVVFFDLFATLVMPATMGYLVYIIYKIASSWPKVVVPTISLILLAAGYGLQVIIFLMKKKWEHIGWLVIYLLALPFFTFVLPLYAFWHFDDFSWGTTRVVVGEKGGKKHIIDEEPFDPLSIPMKRWTEYEQEMFEKETEKSAVSQLSAGSYYGSQVSGMQGSQVFTPFLYHPSGSYGTPLLGVMPPPVYSEYGSDVTGPQQMAYIQQQQQGLPQQQQPLQRQSMMSQQSVQPQQQVQRQSMMSQQQSVQQQTVQPAGYPTNDQIVGQIKTILSTANLMTVTKKQVREELSQFFQCDMQMKKEFINQTIEDVLQGRM